MNENKVRKYQKAQCIVLRKTGMFYRAIGSTIDISTELQFNVLLKDMEKLVILRIVLVVPDQKTSVKEIFVC